MEYFYKNMYEITGAVVEGLKESNDPFNMPVLLFNNTKICQWFKADYLRNSDGVLMNVACRTISSFVNDIINPDRKYTVMTVPVFRDFLIKVLPEIELNEENMQIKYIYSDLENRKTDGTKLFEFAGTLSKILFNMEFDCEDITGWQKEVYDLAVDEAKTYGLYTPRSMFNEKLYTKTAKKVFVINNSYVSELYSRILSEICDVTFFSVRPDGKREDGNVFLYSAPSVIREVEYLHSDICKKTVADKSLRTNDFVVYAPDISVYASAVRTVFGKMNRGFSEATPHKKRCCFFA